MAIFDSNAILTAENLSNLSAIIYKGEIPITPRMDHSVSSHSPVEINFNIPGITSDHYVIDFVLDDKDFQGGTWLFETSENKVTIFALLDYVENGSWGSGGSSGTTWKGLSSIGITLTLILAEVIEQE